MKRRGFGAHGPKRVCAAARKAQPIGRQTSVNRTGSLANFCTPVLVVLVALQLAGCTAGDLLLFDRHGLADRIGASAGLVKTLVTAKPFVLTAYHRIAKPGEALTVYIEGDGQAWLSRSQLAADPTPTDPVALRLAAVDPSPNVVYLARPCHYTEPRLDPFCRPAYWSNKRFAEEVIAAMELQLKAPVEIDPDRLEFRFTHRARHDRAPNISARY